MQCGVVRQGFLVVHTHTFCKHETKRKIMKRTRIPLAMRCGSEAKAKLTAGHTHTHLLGAHETNYNGD